MLCPLYDRLFCASSDYTPLCGAQSLTLDWGAFTLDSYVYHDFLATDAGFKVHTAVPPLVDSNALHSHCVKNVYTSSNLRVALAPGSCNWLFVIYFEARVWTSFALPKWVPTPLGDRNTRPEKISPASGRLVLPRMCSECVQVATLSESDEH